MRAYANRVWMLGGGIGAVVIIALGWLFLVSPAGDEAQGYRQQIELSEVRLIALHKRLAELKDQQAKLGTYQAELKRYQQALPADTGIPAFLRQLEDAGDAVGATVSNINLGQPTPETGAGLTAYSLPVTMTVDGGIGDMGPFLDQLQQVQPRAVLVQAANLAAGEQGKGDAATMTLTMKIFVAPAGGTKPAAGATPAPTTTS
jgi:Tfp pilus assembly protein PilO